MILKRLLSLICMFRRALGLYSILLLAFLFFFMNLPSDAAAGWVKTYNGPGNGDDYAQAIAVDKSGNVYVTGASKGSTSNKDIVTIKYGSKGNQMWVQRYNGPGNNIDYANAITVDSGGNVYVTGAASGTSGGGESSRDFATIKYNTSGKQQWVQRYDAAPVHRGDRSYGVAVDGRGYVYVTGMCNGEGNYGTIKYDGKGKQQWVQEYSGPTDGGYDEAKAIGLDSKGNVYVTGFSEESSSGYYAYATVKYDTNGKQLWANRFTEGERGASAMAVDGSGNVYVTGATFEGYATLKYDTNGKQLWVQTQTSNSFDDQPSLAVDSSGNVYVAGYTGGSASGEDFLIIKYDTNGKQLWVQQYNAGFNSDLPVAHLALALDKNGNAHVAGTATGSSTGYDYATVKYDTNGKKLWAKRYNGSGNGSDFANAIAVDKDGDVYVTGESAGKGSGMDIVTVKYDKNGN